MKRYEVKKPKDIADLIYDFTFTGKEVLYVAKYDEVVSILKALAIYEETTFSTISDIKPSYEKEYYVEIERDMTVWVQDAYIEDSKSYMYTETDVLLISDDCNSCILQSVDYNEAYEIGYPQEECDNQKDNVVAVRVAIDDNGVVRGFEKTWFDHTEGMHYITTYSHYSDDTDSLKAIMKLFNVEI